MHIPISTHPSSSRILFLTGLGLLLSAGCRDKGPLSGGPGQQGDSPGGDSTPILPDTADSSGGVLDDTGGPYADCAESLVGPLPWLAGDTVMSLEGRLELGQTHVVSASGETRHAPSIIEGREALMLFTPAVALSAETDLRVRAVRGGVELGVLAAIPPAASAPLLEQALTAVALAPYGADAWSAYLPWDWMAEGTVLEVGYAAGGTLWVREEVLSGLGAPHRFTLTRSKIVLFGGLDADTATYPAETIAQDYFAAIPAATLQWVDYAPWFLSELVVGTASGPRVVSSEAARVAASGESSRWSILKNQMALRLSLANTGRGLVLTALWEGDSSPYSSGTTVAMGQVYDGSAYTDINNAGLAAGWTGWTALWNSECDNGFIHEVGHAATLYHFTTGTAASWGIGEEYPLDGTHTASHPWGYDSTRRRIRTWYRVDASGPVYSGTALVGKNDPMNGGESANAVTCFPQYTPYHGERIQEWMQASPTIAAPGGDAGIWRWSSADQAYLREAADPLYQEPQAVDVPVVTLIGTLGNTDAACQTYPPLFAASGNTFVLPHPTDTTLPSDFTGARWFLRIQYDKKSDDYALIQEGTITDLDLHLYALNLDLRDAPRSVSLYRAEDAWPAIDLTRAALVHTRAIPAAPDLPAVVWVGEEQLANGTVTLSARCTPGVDCDTRQVETAWRGAGVQRHFTDAPPTTCETPGEYSTLSLPVVDDEGNTAALVVHGQRVVITGSDEVAVPLTDATPWHAAPDLTQSLRLWVPYAENAALPAGHYTLQDTATIQQQADGRLIGETPLAVDLTVYAAETIDVTTPYLHDEGVMLSDASVYYVVEDPSMGPTGPVWWDDGIAGGTRLTVPMVDQTSGAVVTLALEAYKVACGDYWDLNTGQVSDWGCTHLPYLAVAAVGNEGLVSGHTYQSPGSAPLVLYGMRWHEPNAWTLQKTFAFSLRYTAP